MSADDIPYVFLAFLVAAFLKVITGLGFATICLPILSLFLDPRIGIPFVIFPSLMSNVLVMGRVRDLDQALSRFWPLYLFTIPGLFVGVELLRQVDNIVSRTSLHLILVLFSYTDRMGLYSNSQVCR